MYFPKFVIAALLLVVLTGCSTSTRLKVDYRTAGAQAPLEVPPDLDKLSGDSGEQGADTYSAYAAEQAAARGRGSELLPKFKDIEVLRESDVRWLRIKASKKDTWIDIKNYLGDVGLTIETENRATGIIETGWAENRASLGSGGGFVSKLFRRFDTSGEMDRFRVRLENDSPGWLAVYISHQGMVEKQSGGGDAVIQSHWERRPSEPELEAEMLKLLMVYLGTEDKKASSLLASGIRKARATLTKDEKTNARYVIVKATYGRALRRLEATLDRMGATVEANEEGGSVLTILYLLPQEEETNKSGFLGRLFKGGKKKPRQYKIQIVDAGQQTELRLIDAKGLADASTHGVELMKILFERLK